MPIQVTARLCRNGGTYLAGETVECEVTVANTNSADTPGEAEYVAWCSVQVHCQEVLNSQKAKTDVALQFHSRSVAEHQQGAPAGPVTSFAPARGESGSTVYSSRPTILFCDLELLPGGVRKYRYSEVLPADDIPPSYKGHAVKYLYKLTVGVQHVNSAVKLLRVPFRVLVLSGLSHVCLEDNALSPSNPFLHQEQNKATTLDIANQVIENITALKNCHIYNVTNSGGRVAQFTLYKNCFKLGEDVLGHFSFDDCEVTCAQYCVSLQTEEELIEEVRVKPEHRSVVSTHSKQHAVSLCQRETELKLQIPLTATPTFFTDIVHLKWRIHFEFVTTKDELPGCPYLTEEEVGSWQAPGELSIETMVWDLPIKVYPCNPLNACLGSVDVEKAGAIVV